MNPIEQGYITVAERHAKFVEDHPNGVINTELAYAHDGLVIIRASVWKERSENGYTQPDGTGIASMPIPGPTNFTKNSEAENAETSAIGRALAAIGYHPKESMASADEINMKAAEAKAADDKATTAQLNKMMAMGRELYAGMSDIDKQIRIAVKKITGKNRRDSLTKSDMTAIFDTFEAMLSYHRDATVSGPDDF